MLHENHEDSQVYACSFHCMHTFSLDSPKPLKSESEVTQLCPTLNDPDNHDGVVTHLELGVLECEVKWALRSITMNKVSDEIMLGYKVES